MLPLRRLPCLAPLAVWLVSAAVAPQASASGFQLREQSPAAQGNSFAGVSAGGSDIGSMFANPATMTLYPNNEVVVGMSYVMPKSKLEDGAGTRAAVFPAAVRPISGNGSVSNAAKDTLLPELCAMWSLRPDLKLGLSVNAPFGMSTDYDTDFVGRYHALKSDLKVIDIAPSVAFKINEQWSIGAAFVARWADAELSNGVDFGAIGASKGLATVPGDPALERTATLKGNKWGYGYRLGTTFQATDAVRLGLSYQSAISLNLSGDATYSGIPAAIQGVPPLAAAFRNGSATAELNLPSTASLGINVDLTPTLALRGEVSRTGWSTFKEIRVKFSTGLPDSVTEEKWQDTWFYALGLTWKATEAWTLRTGIAYDQSAVKDEYRTPRIPDGDRTWISVGAGYAFSKNASMDCAYTHIFVKDGVMDLKAIPAGDTAATSPNTVRGDLSGTYKNRIDILSLQGRFQF